MLVDERETVGHLGLPALDAIAADAARAAIARDRPESLSVTLDDADHVLFLEPHQPPGELVIVGAGHIARPLARIGASLGFRVTVLDDRPEFATRERFPEAARVLKVDFMRPFADVPLTARTHLVLVTRGHKYDFEALRELLAADAKPAYVGMVGSRRRVRAAYEQLAREGVPADRLASVRAPIGLDVGAETPEEIAVAIAAELVLVRRGGTGTPLRDRERVVERWIRNRPADDGH